MDRIGAFTPEQSRELWQWYLSEKQKPSGRDWPIVDRGTRRLQGRLDGALAAATAFEDDPATATMSVWRKNSDGEMEDSGDSITIVNRFENITVESGAIVKAEWIDGEWQLYAADCEA